MRTVKRLALSAVALGVCAAAFIAWVVWLLVIEGQAVAQGGHSTISELFWSVWAAQPWVILLLNNVAWAIFCTAVGIVSYLGGHFTAQSKETYELERRNQRGASRIACIAGVGILALACMGAKPSKEPKRTLSLHVTPRVGNAQPWRPLTVYATARATGFTCPKFEWDCGQGVTGSRLSDCDPAAAADPVVVDRRACIFFSAGDALVAVRASDSFGARAADALVLVR